MPQKAPRFHLISNMSTLEAGKSAFKPVSAFNFNQPVIPNCCTVGVFDDTKNVQLVAVTTSNKLVLQNTAAVFNFTEAVTCIKAVRLLPDDKHDAIVTGTTTSLVCYDIFNNKTLFHRFMPDVVNCIEFGIIDNYEEPVIICGCGTTIWGINKSGEDVFWTALGDTITGIALVDVDSDEKNELVIGTNGIEIKVYKNLALHCEFTEGDSVVALQAVDKHSFVYGLACGTLGFYQGKAMCWRVKSKNQIAKFVVMPKEEYVVCIWKNGKIDTRLQKTGEIASKYVREEEVADACVANILPDVSPQVIVFYTNGSVSALANQGVDTSEDVQQMIRDFGYKRQNLISELQSYEAPSTVNTEHAAIPVGTSLQSSITCTKEHGLSLTLALSHEVPIRVVTIFAEGVFDSESLVIFPKTEKSGLQTQMFPKKQMATDLHIKLFAGPANFKQMHVFEVSGTILKFATYLIVDEIPAKPEGYMKMCIGFRPSDLANWFINNFYLGEQEENVIEKCKGTGLYELKFICVVTNEALTISIDADGNMEIRHNSVEICGNVVQLFLQYWKIEEQNSVCTFPKANDEIVAAIKAMDTHYELLDKLQTEWAEKLNTARECLVLAENMLNLNKYEKSRKHYVRLSALNRDMIVHHTLRSNARKELLQSVKILTVSIEQHARLRAGKYASMLVSECRKAIENENALIIPRFLQNGIQIPE